MRPYDEYENPQRNADLKFEQNIKPKFTPESGAVPLEEPIPCGIRTAIARLKARAETNRQYLVRISNVLNGFPCDYSDKKCDPDKSPDDACPIAALFEDIDRALLENRAILGSIYAALGINEPQYGFTDPFED